MKPDPKLPLFSRIKKFFRDLRDVDRMAEINRLVTKAGRRCARDFDHATAHIPLQDPCRVEYEERVKMWKRIFWDSASYRDGLYSEIDRLEKTVSELEEQVESLGAEPVSRLPF